MNYHTLYASITSPVSACLVGGGAFGQSFLAQARHIKKLSARIAVDLDLETAGKAFAAAGLSPADIRLCAKATEAKAAFDAGKLVAADRFETVIGLPFDILVEATGHPEAAAVHAARAIEEKRHVLLVTKETDSVAGPILARMARANGVDMTAVDGDQPSLLIGLVTWAETLGFEILCAGKSSEYDFIYDRGTGKVVSNGISADMPDLAAWWAPGARSIRDVAAGRAGVLGRRYPLKTVPDLCEMSLVANATGLGADVPPFHAPVARVPEVAALLSGNRTHGLLSGGRRLDVFHHLRAPDEASFAGGVFVVVRCQDATSWKVLEEKGHVVSADGSTAMLYLPRHLLGVEAATSIIELVGLKLSSYGADYRPRVDLAAVATRDLAAGTHLKAEGHHHTIAGVAGEMHPASPISADRITPYYLVANRKLARPVKAGAPIRLSDLEIEADSTLLTLRRRQDESFASCM